MGNSDDRSYRYRGKRSRARKQSLSFFSSFDTARCGYDASTGSPPSLSLWDLLQGNKQCGFTVRSPPEYPGYHVSYLNKRVWLLAANPAGVSSSGDQR